MSLKIRAAKEIAFNYNQTIKLETQTYFPRSESEIQNLFKKKLKKKKFLIKTGKCAYGDKASLKKSKLTISLINLDKIKSINFKKNIVTVQSGILLIDFVRLLKDKGFFIYNIPGGKNISLGGAISGNVHGRFSTKKFVNFGDNIISLKILNSKGKILNITKKNKLFYKIIGGQSLYGIILEAKLIMHKIKANNFIEETHYINSEKEFINFHKKNNLLFGYIDIFKKKYFSVNIRTLKPLFNKNEKGGNEVMKDVILPKFFSFFVNNLTLKLLYFYLFNLKRKFTFNNKKIISFEKSIYISNYIYTIPSFLKKGFLELQFSVDEKKLFLLIKNLKILFNNFSLYPIFFILKKLNSSKKKYLFNFPKYKFSLTLGFSKKTYLDNPLIFKKIYNLLTTNNCNIYITKDEIFLDNIDKKTLKQKYLKGFDFKNKSNASSDFNEKIKRIFR